MTDTEMNSRMKTFLSRPAMRFRLSRSLVFGLLGLGLETWRDSWYEEGSRLIYLVPRGFVDRVLPLAINPAPGQIVRVFVGRVEIVTPATARAVATAVASNDEVTLNKYGRFLEPILAAGRGESRK